MEHLPKITLLLNVAAFSSSWTFDNLSLYPHCGRFYSLGWHFTVKVAPQEIILGQLVPLGSELLSHDSGAVFSVLSIVKLTNIFFYIVPPVTSVFCNIVHVPLLNA